MFKLESLRLIQQLRVRDNIMDSTPLNESSFDDVNESMFEPSPTQCETTKVTNNTDITNTTIATNISTSQQTNLPTTYNVNFNDDYLKAAADAIGPSWVYLGAEQIRFIIPDLFDEMKTQDGHVLVTKASFSYNQRANQTREQELANLRGQYHFTRLASSQDQDDYNACYQYVYAFVSGQYLRQRYQQYGKVLKNQYWKRHHPYNHQNRNSHRHQGYTKANNYYQNRYYRNEHQHNHHQSRNSYESSYAYGNHPQNHKNTYNQHNQQANTNSNTNPNTYYDDYKYDLEYNRLDVDYNDIINSQKQHREKQAQYKKDVFDSDNTRKIMYKEKKQERKADHNPHQDTNRQQQKPRQMYKEKEKVAIYDAQPLQSDTKEHQPQSDSSWNCDDVAEKQKYGLNTIQSHPKTQEVNAETNDNHNNSSHMQTSLNNQSQDLSSRQGQPDSQGYEGEDDEDYEQDYEQDDDMSYGDDNQFLNQSVLDHRPGLKQHLEQSFSQDQSMVMDQSFSIIRTAPQNQQQNRLLNISAADIQLLKQTLEQKYRKQEHEYSFCGESSMSQFIKKNVTKEEKDQEKPLQSNTVQPNKKGEEVANPSKQNAEEQQNQDNEGQQCYSIKTGNLKEPLYKKFLINTNTQPGTEMDSSSIWICNSSFQDTLLNINQLSMSQVQNTSGNLQPLTMHDIFLHIKYENCSLVKVYKITHYGEQISTKEPVYRDNLVIADQKVKLQGRDGRGTYVWHIGQATRRFIVEMLKVQCAGCGKNTGCDRMEMTYEFSKACEKCGRQITVSIEKEQMKKRVEEESLDWD